jgi:hypothetical protein
MTTHDYDYMYSKLKTLHTCTCQTCSHLNRQVLMWQNSNLFTTGIHVTPKVQIYDPVSFFHDSDCTQPSVPCTSSCQTKIFTIHKYTEIYVMYTLSHSHFAQSVLCNNLKKTYISQNLQKHSFFFFLHTHLHASKLSSTTLLCYTLSLLSCCSNMLAIG